MSFILLLKTFSTLGNLRIRSLFSITTRTLYLLLFLKIKIKEAFIYTAYNFIIEKYKRLKLASLYEFLVLFLKPLNIFINK